MLLFDIMLYYAMFYSIMLWDNVLYHVKFKYT